MKTRLAMSDRVLPAATTTFVINTKLTNFTVRTYRRWFIRNGGKQLHAL